jgi:acetolactate synthase-1/2/3 large subunit
MMAKILYPDKQVTAVVGDGGLMINLWDLATIVRLQLDMTLIVLNDNAYGMIKWKQNNMWLTNFSLDLNNPDFIKLAESFWANTYKVQTTWEFTEALKLSKKHNWLKLIEVALVYPEKIE